MEAKERDLLFCNLDTLWALDQSAFASGSRGLVREMLALPLYTGKNIDTRLFCFCLEGGLHPSGNSKRDTMTETDRYKQTEAHRGTHRVTTHTKHEPTKLHSQWDTHCVWDTQTHTERQWDTHTVRLNTYFDDINQTHRQTHKRTQRRNAHRQTNKHTQRERERQTSTLKRLLWGGGWRANIPQFLHVSNKS